MHKEVIAGYIPVIHKGYMEYFDAFPSAKECYLFSDDLLSKVDYLRKDLRALTPEQQKSVIEGMGRFDAVYIISDDASLIDNETTKVIMPDEDISREVGKTLTKASIEYYPVFLRWDRRNTEGINAAIDDETITEDDFARDIMQSAMQVAGQSSDIWRRVGAVLIASNEERLSAHNVGEPTEHSPWMEGDPRNVFSRGVGIEMSVFTHAEAGLIAEAARRGVKLQGADLYVTTYPCPACAKLIAHSGIKRLFYHEGYAVLDGRRELDEYGVEAIKVLMEPSADDATDSRAWVPYKK